MTWWKRFENWVMEGKPDRKDFPPRALYVFLGFFGFLLFVLVIFKAIYGPPSPSPEPTGTCRIILYNARYAAEHFVKQRLVAPATAQFSYPGDVTTHVKRVKDSPEGKPRFTILGYVDSQNRLGALVRSEFFVVLKYCRSSSKFYLEDIAVVPR